MSKIKPYVLCINGTEYLINARKTTDEDGLRAIKIWFDYKGEEQSVTLGFESEKSRKQYWKEMNIKTVLRHINMFGKGEVTIPKGETNERTQ